LKERREVTKSCLSLCDPINSSLSGSSVHVIFQVRILEWVAFPSPGDLPNPGIEPKSPTLQAETLKTHIRQEIQHLATIQTWRGHGWAQITLFRVDGVTKTQTWFSDFTSFFQCFCITFDSLFNETRLTYISQNKVIWKLKAVQFTLAY